MNILWEYTHDKLDTVDKVIHILTTRYGNNGLVERYRMELRTRRRQPNETLPQLLQDIQRLTSLAFPGPSNDTREIIARDAYIDALNDPVLALKIREREPSSLEETHNITMLLESYNRLQMTQQNVDTAILCRILQITLYNKCKA